MTTGSKSIPFITATLLLFLFSSTQSFAYVFRVLGVSGKVKVKHGESESIIRAGTQLLPGQTIILESGYCGLLHAKGKTLELKKPGQYSVEDLDKKIGSSANVKVKVSDKYFDYIMGQLSKSEAEDVEKSVRKHMEVPGAVQRGSESSKGIGTARLHAFPKNEILADTYTVSWNPAPGINSYSVELKDRFDEIILSKKGISDTKYQVDFSGRPSPDSYTLTVTYAGSDTSKYKEYEFKVNPKNIVELQTEDDPATNLLNGILCEEKFLFLDALKYYEKAARLEPEVAAYQEALNKLKTRLGKK